MIVMLTEQLNLNDKSCERSDEEEVDKQFSDYINKNDAGK